MLDLFCGAGGASVGYSRVGFKITGVDIVDQPNYPFEFYQMDALEFPLEGYDVIHASPPCQAYTARWNNKKSPYPRLIEPIREKLRASGRLYIIENIPTAPVKGEILCGTMFNLLVLRHRVFETNWELKCGLKCNHWGTVASGDFAAVYKYGAHGHRKGKTREPRAAKGPKWHEAMNIEWMSQKEMIEAIPPAYTEYVGRQLKKKLNVKYSICERCGRRFVAERSTRKFCSDNCRVYAHLEKKRTIY